MTNTGKSSKYLKITLAVFLGFTSYILSALMVYKESFAMTEKKKIVMIGDSITYGGNWNELLKTEVLAVIELKIYLNVWNLY
jgi:hypothetical protein